MNQYDQTTKNSKMVINTVNGSPQHLIYAKKHQKFLQWTQERIQTHAQHTEYISDGTIHWQ